MKYCIIGNSAAAVGAVEAIRSVDGGSPITVVSREPYYAYSRPMIPRFLAGKISEEAMYYRGEAFYRKHGVTLLLGREALNVDVEKRQVRLDDGTRLEYDRLLLATGSKPAIPPVEGLNLPGVSTFTTWEDAWRLRRLVEEGASKALIVGGGLIGLKAAESLQTLGLEVTVAVRGPRVLRRIVDEAASKIVEAHLSSKGIQVIAGNTVKKFLGGRRVEAAVLADGRRVACDLAVIAVGVQPDSTLAEAAGVKVGLGVAVDSRMETSVKGVYAAGDVAEAYDLVHGKRRVTPVWPNAYRQGYVAGINMAGGSATYPGSLDMNSLELFSLPIVAVGLTNPPDGGYEVFTRLENENVYRKVVLKDGRIVGVILIGEIDRAGIFTGLIRSQTNVESFKKHLVEPGFGYAFFPEDLRRELLAK